MDKRIGNEIAIPRLEESWGLFNEVFTAFKKTISKAGFHSFKDRANYAHKKTLKKKEADQ